MPSTEFNESKEPESEGRTATEAVDPGTADTKTTPAENGEKETSSGGRTGVAIAGVLLLVCGSLVGYGVLDSEDKPKAPAVSTAEVTYEVTGEGRAEISYLARGEDGTATVEKGVSLPWKKTVDVPAGKSPVVAIVLDGKGGQAACTLAIRGEHVQRATATGAFGRATCTGELPATER